MARADLLLQLVDAALAGDQVRVRRVVEALSAEEQAKRHTVLADELGVLLDRAPRPGSLGMGIPVAASAGTSDGLLEVEPKRRLHDLFLPELVRDELATLITEQHRADLLRAYNIEPRHRVLLVGPPGNGKTSCAEALATELAVPLLVLRYETVITSFLGETSANLGAVLDDVRRRHCVLFLDEFDTLAKERGDEHDTGEIKRVVSTLLLQLDRLPAHVVICAATNHSELLDRAVWRRFQLRLELPSPSRAQRASYVDAVSDRLGLRLARSSRTLADKLGSASYAEIEEFCVEIRRHELLDDDFAGGPAPAQVVDRMIAVWNARAGIDRTSRKSSSPSDD
jgi:SpoVK/Ycf46/Vps4 family AAA+-type ATPase